MISKKAQDQLDLRSSVADPNAGNVGRSFLVPPRIPSRSNTCHQFKQSLKVVLIVTTNCGSTESSL